MSDPTHVKIDISTVTIVKIVAVLLGIWFLFTIREIVVLFLLVLIIVAALTPIVNKMSKYVPRSVAVVSLALILALGFVGVGFLIVPPLVFEIKQFALNLPTLTNQFGPLYHSFQLSVGSYQESLLNISSQLGKLTSGIYSTTLGFISGLLAFFTIIVLSFYMLLEKESIKTLAFNFISDEKHSRAASILDKISEKMSQWLGGHLLLMLTVGIFDGVALMIMGVPYVLILGIWGGLMELIPYLGPWLAALPAILIALSISPWLALIVAIVFLIIQQIEATFLAPKIIGQAVGLSPVIVILSLLTGAKLMGIIGVIISVPIAAIISVLISNWPEIKNLARS